MGTNENTTLENHKLTFHANQSIGIYELTYRICPGGMKCYWDITIYWRVCYPYDPSEEINLHNTFMRPYWYSVRLNKSFIEKTESLKNWLALYRSDGTQKK